MNLGRVDTFRPQHEGMIMAITGFFTRNHGVQERVDVIFQVLKENHTIDPEIYTQQNNPLRGDLSILRENWENQCQHNSSKINSSLDEAK